MADCRTCKRTDVKCCPTCGRGDDCNIYHKCGEDCIGHKPMTNADRIRSMTDEELAKVIMCPYDRDDRDERDCKEGCWKCCLKWLKSEVGCE